MDALNDILTGDLNALLLKKLRNEYGLVYDCSGILDIDEASKDFSYLTIETLCNTKKFNKCIKNNEY